MGAKLLKKGYSKEAKRNYLFAAYKLNYYDISSIKLWHIKY